MNDFSALIRALARRVQLRDCNSTKRNLEGVNDMANAITCPSCQTEIEINEVMRSQLTAQRHE